jgi:hypothetical protein
MLHVVDAGSFGVDDGAGGRNRELPVGRGENGAMRGRAGEGLHRLGKPQQNLPAVSDDLNLGGRVEGTGALRSSKSKGKCRSSVILPPS